MVVCWLREGYSPEVPSSVGAEENLSSSSWNSLSLWESDCCTWMEGLSWIKLIRNHWPPPACPSKMQSHSQNLTHWICAQSSVRLTLSWVYWSAFELCPASAGSSVSAPPYPDSSRWSPASFCEPPGQDVIANMTLINTVSIRDIETCSQPWPVRYQISAMFCESGTGSSKVLVRLRLSDSRPIAQVGKFIQEAEFGSYRKYCSYVCFIFLKLKSAFNWL